MSILTTPKPFDSGFLPEKDGHKVSYAQYGNRDGVKIVSLHGGPGSKSKPQHAASFNLKECHLVTFDQRGCGKSEPLGKLENNTTPDLIDDIERLRKHLKIKDWFVTGASWGSTLALAYAQGHPDKVKGLLLSSIFLARKKDIRWSFYDAIGVTRLFPDLFEHHQRFLARHGIQKTQQAEQLLNLVQDSEGEKQQELIAELMSWEGNLMTSQKEVGLVEAESVTEEDIASISTFLHYDSNDCFLEDNQLLNGMEAITHIPAVLVHGRHDILCPLDGLWELQKKFDQVRTVILPVSNHKLTTEGTIAMRLAYELFLTEWKQ
ncbi:MAG: alpha/beta fold hydrolase [Patescibacteria group bacterium]